MPTIRKRGASYFLDWYQNGQRIQKSLGKVSKREADKALQRLIVKLQSGFALSPYFKNFSREYLNWYATEYPASYPRIKIVLVNHLDPFFEFARLDEIGSLDIKRYQSQRMSAGIKIETYNKELQTLKAMLNRAVEWEQISRNPISHVRTARNLDSKPPRFFTSDDLKELYSQSSTYRWQWQFMANTGLRRGEAMHLDIKRDIGSDAIRVISEDGARTKSGKWREVPLFDGAREALTHIQAAIFPDMYGSSISRAFSKDAKRAALEGSLHSLRHTFCSHLAMSGDVSLIEIKEWAGHSSVTTTQRYQHLVPGFRKHDPRLLHL